MSNEYRKKKVSNHLLITVSRSTCNSLVALSIYLFFSLPCPFAVAIYVSRFFLSFSFLSLSLSHSPLKRSFLFALTTFFTFSFVSSLFLLFSLIITIYVMIFVNTHKKKKSRLSSNKTIIFIKLWSEIEFVSFANKVDHYIFCCCCCSLLQLNKMLFSKWRNGKSKEFISFANVMIKREEMNEWFFSANNNAPLFSCHIYINASDG